MDAPSAAADGVASTITLSRAIPRPIARCVVEDREQPRL
jgi:hypothetical protein